MQHINEIIDFYLKDNSNFALLITGEWGTGKTYFFKNILRKQIEETPMYEDASKNYKPILISLFGIKSIEEIQTQIFLSIYPLLKSKSIKLGTSLLKPLIQAIIKLNSLGDMADFIPKIDLERSDLIKINELVICFDDLERLSTSINIEEVIGYINSLVENENIKILIIANENKIDKAKFTVLKEKIIGNTIEFIPDNIKSYEGIIETLFKGSPSYHTFLTKNKTEISNLFNKHSSNLRILKFATSYFHRIYSEIKNNLTSENILKEREDEILMQLLKFTVSISIEYKEGRISFKNRQNLNFNGVQNWANISLDDIIDNNNQTDNESTYKNQYLKEYYLNDNYFYFNSIFEFLTGGPILKKEDLISELYEIYHIKDNKFLPQYEILDKLGYPNVYSLSDKTYLNYTKEMLKFSNEGKYDISNYLNVFHFATRMGNPLRLNMDKLTTRIISGMKKGQAEYRYNSSLKFAFALGENVENKTYLTKIKNAALDLNEQIQNKSVITDSKRLEKLCFSNFKLFYSEILTREGQYLYSPILQNFNAVKFYRQFSNGENEKKWQMIRFINNRFTEQKSFSLKPEIQFLESIRMLNSEKIKKLPKSGLKQFLFNEFNTELDYAIVNLSQEI